MATENQAFDALAAILAAITWGAGTGWADTGRKLVMWDKAPQPAAYQVEGDELIRHTPLPTNRRSLKANWVIWHNAGKDQNYVPSRTSSDILDALVLAMQPKLAGSRQTLGGFVYDAYIDGKITKDNGDLDGQAMLIVPITLILP